jgi:DNA-binding response OmpR family regulator
MLGRGGQKVLIGIAAPAYAGSVAQAFAEAGFVPVLAFAAEHAREFADREAFDLVVTCEDVDPDAHLVRDVADRAQPVRIFLGGAGRAMPSGVHAALPRDVGPGELVLRARAMLTLRTGPTGDGVLRYGPLQLDLARREVRWRGDRRTLTPIQFRILVALVEKQGAVIGRAELQRAVWKWSPPDNGERLVAHIRRIRAKLEDDPSCPRFLLTARGEGFRLADVSDNGHWDGVERRRGERRRPEVLETAHETTMARQLQFAAP